VSVRLRPLREDEYPAFAEVSNREYADEMVANGGFSREQAAQKAERDFTRILPDGLETPGHHINVIEVEPGGEAIGRLWYALEERGGRRIVFLYDIKLDPAQRGRGHGRAAMLELERAVAELGRDRIELNVFGGNQRARGLYASLGYEEMAVTMVKQLPA
jgi:ribosomal protein S18 acetylase RimI-like enzyme